MSPVFTSIGLAIGASAATAFAVGAGATALTLGAVGVGAYALAGGFDSDQPGGDSRVDSALETGKLTDAEARSSAKKKAYRAGIIHTTPTGLDSEPKTSSAKLK